MNTEKTTRRLLGFTGLAAGLFVSVLGCKSAWWSSQTSEAKLDSALNSADWNDPSSRTALLSLSADDYQGLSSRGSPLQWQPLLMPLRTGFALTDRNFALGMTGALGNIDGRIPELGQCQRLSNSSTINEIEQRESASLNTVEIELQDPKGQRKLGSGGQLFIIHDQVARFVKAVGFWDDDGRATCPLPAGRWFVSTGFGEARTHKPFLVSPNRETKITLRAHPRARLIIRTGKDTGLQFGDLMRIGRIRAQTPAPQVEDQLPEVPLLIQDDLMRTVLTPSENRGVREYLFTSLLLQRPEFSIPLEPGEYAIGLWRDGFIQQCASRLVIQPGDVAVLACDPGTASPTINTPDSIGTLQTVNFVDARLRSIVFDGSFMPSKLLTQNQFRAWMAKSGVNRFLRAGRSLDSQQQQFQFSLQSLLQTISADGALQQEGPFIGDFRLTQKADTDEKMGRAAFARVLYAQAGMNLDSFFSRVFSLSFANSLPMAGVSERGILDGVVPLTFRTYLKNYEGRTFRSEDTEAFVSNGAQFEWIEPSPAFTGTPIKLGPQQRIRLRLKIPPEDTTEFLTMYVNGLPHKQWPVPTSPLKNMVRSIEIDEKITLATDFYLGFSSWGKNYLPEFMFGMRQLPAVGLTRIYCVDINENGVCDR